ncbi:hypothetical protein ONA70_12895 [Micromonospora yasonensis]|uniref:hypothetical protein n=1 Tax=Micromonospora yasonensis TaxID=1128667 RepID=UPI0022329CED|nr:hypothetical protein [Micromonospora yasonensis]MCW3840997.1 hypothetical protein [Micromonospora yasonensis]
MTGTSDDGTGAGRTDDAGEPAGLGGTAIPDPSRGARPAGRWRSRWRDHAARLRDQARERANEWWPKVRPLLDQFRWSDEPQPAVTIVDRRVPPALLVPAQGQVYGFVVRATFTWSSDAVRPELFGWYVDYFQPLATQRLRRIAARCARETPPHRPREVENALYEALTGDDAPPWRYERGEVAFTCELDVSVHLDERVRRLLQPYWDRRIALECERDLDRRRAEYEEERNRRGPADQDAPSTSDRNERPPHQREAGAGGESRGPGGRSGPGWRVPRPDSPVEQFTPLEPLLPPPAPRPPRSAPGPRSAPAQPGEKASGDPEHPGPPDH